MHNSDAVRPAGKSRRRARPSCLPRAAHARPAFLFAPRCACAPGRRPASATSGLTGGSSLGTLQVSVAQLSPAASGETPGLVTITVPTTVLGTPGAGWTFTVALTGQNGWGGTDDARTFTATPGQYTFGVCSAAVAGGSSPPAICSYNPAAVPIVMDTIPPASVNVQTELDPTANPSGVAPRGLTSPSPDPAPARPGPRGPSPWCRRRAAVAL
jgi:hypothetical protein